jgi:ABC-type transporter Mla maintaining outer membrane lipid asymmetry permease subunit MlaE
VLHQDDLGDGVFLGSQADVLMLTRVIIALALSLLTGSVAEAQVWRSGGAFGVFRSVGTVQGNFPLDGFATQPTACYSERRLRSAYAAGLGVRIIRASDSEELDIGFSSGMPNTAAETAHCAATICKTVTMYDQCGSNNLTQVTSLLRFIRQAGPGTFRVGQATAGTQTMAGESNITPVTGVMSFATVFNRAVGTGQCRLQLNGANQIWRARSALANTWQLSGGTSGLLNTASAFPDGTWHAAAGNFADSAANILVNSTQANGGNTVSNTTAGAPGLNGSNATTCEFLEAIIWDNYILTLGERTYLNNTARIAWGI